jgi:hypothetical protein
MLDPYPDPHQINTDLKPWEQEYELVRSWGLSEAHIVRSNVNAISSSFLPAGEKKAMLRKLYEVYHIHLD